MFAALLLPMTPLHLSSDKRVIRGESVVTQCGIITHGQSVAVIMEMCLWARRAADMMETNNSHPSQRECIVRNTSAVKVIKNCLLLLHLTNSA